MSVAERKKRSQRRNVPGLGPLTHALKRINFPCRLGHPHEAGVPLSLLRPGIQRNISTGPRADTEGLAGGGHASPLVLTG